MPAKSVPYYPESADIQIQDEVVTVTVGGVPVATQCLRQFRVTFAQFGKKLAEYDHGTVVPFPRKDGGGKRAVPKEV